GLFEGDVIVRDAIGDQRPGDSRHGVLAGGEDVEDDDLIGQPQGLAELLPELHGPRVQVGLEDRPYASAVGDDPAGGGQHGTQLGGVMGVVVDDAHTAGDAAFLEAAAGATVSGQPGSGAFDIGAEAVGHSDRGGGVECVVQSRLTQLEVPRFRATGQVEDEARTDAG